MVDVVMQRLAAMGVDLPVPPQPMGSYVPVIEAGSMLFVSMQGPLVNGRPAHIGLLGHALSVEQGREAAQWAAINALAQIHRHLGSFTRIRQIIRLDGYVACTDEFLSHPQVIDGASDLLAAAFEERAGHVRSLCGVRNLPGNIPVGVAICAELLPAASQQPPADTFPD